MIRNNKGEARAVAVKGSSGQSVPPKKKLIWKNTKCKQVKLEN